MTTIIFVYIYMQCGLWYNFQFDLDAIISCANYINGKPKTQLQHKHLCNKMCVMEQNASSSCQFCILSTTIYTCHWWAQHVFFKYSVGMLPVSFCYMHVNTPNVLKLSAKRVLFVYRYFNFWYFHTSIVLFVGLRLR